jgi:hypothetical protein
MVEHLILGARLTDRGDAVSVAIRRDSPISAICCAR